LCVYITINRDKVKAYRNNISIILNKVLRNAGKHSDLVPSVPTISVDIK